MIINQSVSGFIPASDLTFVIREYLAKCGYENAAVSYKIESRNAEHDVLSQFPPEHFLAGISFTCNQPK